MKPERYTLEDLISIGRLTGLDGTLATLSELLPRRAKAP